MQDCEIREALKRAAAFLGFVDVSTSADDISLGLRFVNLGEQQTEDPEDDKIVHAYSSASGAGAGGAGAGLSFTGDASAGGSVKSSPRPPLESSSIRFERRPRIG